MIWSDAPLGEAVILIVGIVSVACGVSVFVETIVGVVITEGVIVFGLTTIGVAVNIEGVRVGGRKGVGPPPGWMIQPLHADNINVMGIISMEHFIFFSSDRGLYPVSSNNKVSDGEYITTVPLSLQDFNLHIQLECL